MPPRRAGVAHRNVTICASSELPDRAIVAIDAKLPSLARLTHGGSGFIGAGANRTIETLSQSRLVGERLNRTVAASGLRCLILVSTRHTFGTSGGLLGRLVPPCWAIHTSRGVRGAARTKSPDDASLAL